MLLSRFPRILLAALPTRLEKLSRLSSHLGVTIYAKRDDQTGVGGGGNKIRKLEFLLGEALAQGADTIITQGAVQSNHVRQTAAMAAKLGLKCQAILERRIPNTAESFDTTGNVLLDRLFGIEALRFVAAGTDMNAEMAKDAEALKAQGRKPYIVPGGGSTAVGALGYVNAALELVAQVNAQHLNIDHVIVASGSSGTHAGLAAGFKALSTRVNLIGISVRQPEAFQVAKVADEAGKVASLLGTPAVTPDEIIVNSDYVGQGYGIPAEHTFEAIMMAARFEGMLLDPVYTGKAFAGLLGLIRTGRIKQGETVVFFHTGGDYGLFAYEKALLQHV
ncbi:MAG: D-cysteine desulfhydrase [Holosporales bacterium]